MEKEFFIENAVKVHGNKYDYTNLPLTFRGTDKIPIICKEHGEFLQIARNHIHGVHTGCPICGRLKANKSMTDTFETFIKKARKIHGDKYEYIEESFKKTGSKLKIKCNKCGKIFEQVGTMHLSGCGCSYCNPPHTKLTTEQFKEKLSVTHPNLEVLSEYISTNKPITVRCKIHDYIYTTTPHRLVQGSNCQKCYDDRRGAALRKSYEEVLNKLNILYGEKYTFPNFQKEYFNSKSKITVFCHHHGEFMSTVNKLLSNHGCPKCACERNGIRKRLPLDKCLEKCNKKHNFKYTYPKIKGEYITTSSYVTINCPEHGLFKQNIGTHMYGCGCPRCNESHLERDTNILLNEYKIVPNREKKFDWLRNDKTGFVLPLDFYLPDYNIAVECQGGQHFMPAEGFGGKEEFEKIKYRDLIKYHLCKDNNVKLLYITNKKFKRYLNQKQFNGIYDKNVYFIEDLLENKIQLINIFDGDIQNI